VQIRTAVPADYPAVAELTAAVYLADGLVSADSPYLAELRDAERRAGQAELVVAVRDGRVIGSVTFALPGSELAELAGPGEAELRMLAVDPPARGTGVGRALVAECLRRARAAGVRTLRLSTGRRMRVAHRLYQGLGFRRTPDRDWSPAPGVTLLTYALDLTARYCDQCGRALAEGGHQPCAQARELDPPRWCGHCRRRMTVQVTPTGWAARCAEHGERHG
jgi:ribosomal protein S18 acetylase RimI-like enzyme